LARSNRNTAADLGPIAALREDPSGFSLFAALRLIESSDDRQPRLGESARPVEDLIRLGQPPFLHFAESEIAPFDKDPSGRERLMQYGFGAFGPNGALPLHLTELAFQRQRDDPALADFVNMFQHRLVALFFRAWAQADPTTQADRPESDEFLDCLSALVGLGTPTAKSRDRVADCAKAARAGLLGQQSRSADALVALLSDYFQLPFELRPYSPEWLEIPEQERLRLGRAQNAARLGISATLGEASWQVQSSFEIVLGPIERAQLPEFLPGGPALEALRSLVKLFTNDEWHWQLRIVICDGAGLSTVLGQGARLGWSSWIGEQRALADDVVLAGTWTGEIK
jgi:type VI secretion system protein ImpH